MSRIVVGVAGGIAAYKACELVRRLKESGHDVTVVPTPNALHFVGEVTWAALSGNPVRTHVFDAPDEVPHVHLGRGADLVVVAPATADLLARAATGRADDLLTSTLLTATCPIVMAPAMHTEMWHHAATQANVATLRERGVVVIEPAVGRLTGKDSGAGRLPEAEDIAATCAALVAAPEAAHVAQKRDLSGRRVVVSAGGTHEPLDPVRFLGNASSGRMGLEIARAAALRGAQVTLIAANVALALPSGCDVVRVGTARELQAAVDAATTDADVVVMAAAVADYRPCTVAEGKIKKSGDEGLMLDLVQNPDILHEMCARRAADPSHGPSVIVGFAAETAGSRAELQRLGQGKLVRKGCDLLVCNDVSGGGVFGAADNDVLVLGREGIVAEVAGDKAVVAHAVCTAARRALERV